MSAITPNARNHEGLNAKDSRFVDVPDLPWEDTKFPGVKAKTLLVDESSGLLTVLLKMDPGARLPHHEHVLIEQTYVIEGELVDPDGVCTAGNFVWRPAGTRHAAYTPPTRRRVGSCSPSFRFPTSSSSTMARPKTCWTGTGTSSGAPRQICRPSAD